MPLSSMQVLSDLSLLRSCLERIGKEIDSSLLDTGLPLCGRLALPVVDQLASWTSEMIAQVASFCKR